VKHTYAHSVLQSGTDPPIAIHHVFVVYIVFVLDGTIVFKRAEGSIISNRIGMKCQECSSSK